MSDYKTSPVMRVIASYNFEGGGYVSITAAGDVSTTTALDMVETLTRLKREEIAALPTPPEDTDHA